MTDLFETGNWTADEQSPITDDHIIEAFESVGMVVGRFYGRTRLLAAGRLLISMATDPGRQDGP